jgi:adenine-specific DNA-methyltransferase
LQPSAIVEPGAPRRTPRAHPCKPTNRQAPDPSNNKEKLFTRPEPLSGLDSAIHAEGRWVAKGELDDDPAGIATVGVVIGPQYGPITAKMVEEVIRPAGRLYEDLVFAGFSFDGAAQAAIEEGHPRLRIHMAHIRPDVNPAMDGLLKEQPGAKLFSVFGQPRTGLDGPDPSGEYRVVIEGVDIDDPVKNEITPSRGDNVAAWFVDAD